MNDSLRQIIYTIGLVTVFYLLFRYILPIAFKAVGYILGIFLYVIIIAFAIAAVIYFAKYLYQKFEK